jgi:DNA-directed RNA polymerase specialized sigma subunit
MTPKKERVVTPRDAEYFEKVKVWRKLKPGFLREKLYAELRKTQLKHLEFYAYKFQSPVVAMDQDDARAAAEIGFLRALGKWNPTRGSWITCLFLWVRREVQDEQAKAPVVYRPHNTAKPYKVYRAQEAYEAKHGHKPEPDELGVTQKLWDLWEKDSFFTRKSLDSSKLMSDDNRPDFELESSGLNPEENLLLKEEHRDLDALTEVERNILLTSPSSEEAQAIRDAFNADRDI